MHYHLAGNSPCASSRSHRICRDMNETSSSKNFDVFNFNNEDELSEFADRKQYNKFSNLSADTSPVLKYRFLELVSRGGNNRLKEVREAPCVDVDAEDSDPSSDNYFRFSNSARDGHNLHFGADAPKQSIILSGASLTRTDLIPESPSKSNPSRDEWDHHIQTGYKKPISIFHEPADSDPCSGNCQLASSILESPSNKKSHETLTDADESMTETSSLTPLSNAHEYDCDAEASDDHLGGWEVANIDKAVCFSPDYVALRDEYSTDSLLVFTNSCIQLKYSDCIQETRVLKWGIDDIIDIKSQWYGGIETVHVMLHVISKDALIVDNNTQRISGVEEIKFGLVEPNWSEKLEEIKSLNFTYNSRWNIEFDDSDENNMLEQNDDYSQEHYFPSFNEPFEVVYPKGDIDAVSISKRDVDLLKPDTFINDTIIDFYLKYLKNKIHPEAKHRFHFFNSFFFRKLADLDKDPSSGFDGRAAFLRVRKWTRKVNLFEKDFIFIPVNFSFHWSLLVICHVGEVTNFKDDNIRKSFKVPCILHMDSIKGSHSGLKDIIQGYLWEEWKEKYKETSEDLSTKFFNLRFVSLELPQQENSFDCGLFLLHYAEHFLEDAPINFNPFKLTKHSKFLSANWFSPSVVSLKRTYIQRLIYDLLQNLSEEAIDNCLDEQLPESNRNINTGVEFLGESLSPKQAFSGNLSTSQVGQGIEMTLLPTSPLRNLHCVQDSGIVLREFFDSGAVNGTHFKSFNSMSPILEEDEGDQQVEYSISVNLGQLPEYIPKPCNLTQVYTDSGKNQHNNEAADPETASCGSQNSLDTGFHKITSQWKGQDPDPNIDTCQGALSISPEKKVCSGVFLTSDQDPCLEARLKSPSAAEVLSSDPDQCQSKKPGSVLQENMVPESLILTSIPELDLKQESWSLSPEIVCSNEYLTPDPAVPCQKESSPQNMNHFNPDKPRSPTPHNDNFISPDPVAPCQNEKPRIRSPQNMNRSAFQCLNVQPKSPFPETTNLIDPNLADLCQNEKPRSPPSLRNMNHLHLDADHPDPEVSCQNKQPRSPSPQDVKHLAPVALPGLEQKLELEVTMMCSSDQSRQLSPEAIVSSNNHTSVSFGQDKVAIDCMESDASMYPLRKKEKRGPTSVSPLVAFDMKDESGVDSSGERRASKRLKLGLLPDGRRKKLAMHLHL